MISTYFVRSSDDANTQKHHIRHNDHISRSLTKNSVKIDAARSSQLAPKKEFYYYDYNDEALIDIARDKSTPRPTSRFRSFHSFKVVTPVAFDGAEDESERKDSNIEDRFQIKADVQEPHTTKSTALRWRKEPTPKLQEFHSLEFAETVKKRLTPNPDSAKQPPGNGYYIIA